MGTAYHGWQVQINALSVQQKLNECLSVYFKQPVETLGCGRTDTGVHATQYFAHLDLNLKQPLTSGQTQTAIKSLNALLPHDIAIKNIFLVKPDNHARFDAVLRAYEYHIHFKKDPFKTDRSWLFKENLDIDAMNLAASFLPAYNDFASFCKAGADNLTTICKVSTAFWQKEDHKLVFHIEADRFLRNMVRAIVGTLVDVGKGKIPPDAIKIILEKKERSAAGASVPACGLYLTKIVYPYLSVLK